MPFSIFNEYQEVQILKPLADEKFQVLYQEAVPKEVHPQA
jgi:hypothetical protein